MTQRVMAEVLEQATNQDGSRRFYPRGEHPATARLRAYIKALETLPATVERDQALEYVRVDVETFERGEDRAKRTYLRAHEGSWGESYERAMLGE